MNWIKINDQPLSKNNTSRERVIVEKNSDTMPPIFKGTTKLAAKLSRVAFVLVDINSKKNWVNRLAEHHLIEGDIFGVHYKTYEHYALAWPISDREYVLEATWSLDLNNKFPNATLVLSSTNHTKYPLRKDRVRGHLHRLEFHLKEVGPETTEIMVEIKVDPKGKLPPFLADTIQKNWPLTTLRALHKELKQSEDKHTLFL